MKNWKKSFAMFAISLVLGISLMPMKLFADGVKMIDTFDALLAAFDATWEEESGNTAVMLTNDIEQTYGDGDYLAVNSGWNFVLNLNGHTLTLRNDGARGLVNYGKLTITGNGTITNGDSENESYGLVDNYGGEVVVENGNFVDYGLGGGAALKNRTVQDNQTSEIRQGTMTIEAANIHSYGHAAGNACVYSDGVLVVNDGVTMVNDATDEMHGGYFGSYAVTVNSGTATFGSTVGKINNPVVVTGGRGGLAVNGGDVVVNNGIYTGGKYYGMWITNNGDRSSVDVKYAEATGKIYGLYSTVDDGKQDLSDVKIAIENGKYSGGTKAAVAMNSKNSEHSWGMVVSGGDFSTKPDESYLSEGDMIYEFDDEEYPYSVGAVTKYELNDEAVEISYGKNVTVKPTVTPLTVGSRANKNAKYDVTVSGDVLYNDGVVSTNNTAAGEGEISFRFYDGVEKKVKVTVGELKAEVQKDTDTTDGDAEVARFTAQEVVDAVIRGGTAEGFEYNDGVTANDVLSAAANGETITTAIGVGDKDESDLSDDEFMKVASVIDRYEDELTVAKYYNIDVELINATQGKKIGRLTELGDEIVITVSLPENMPAVSEGYERSYKMIRYHNGVADVLDAADNGDGTISFKSRLFSTYVLVYNDNASVTAPDTGIYSKDSATGARISQLFGAFSVIGVVGVVMIMRRMQLASWKRQRMNAKK